MRSVETRLTFAQTVEELTISGEAAQVLWGTAIASIADASDCPLYRGLQIRPQLGLLPIGRDPDSGLWEFAHVQSGAVPKRDKQGELIFTGETCVVLVLLPGGGFDVGAQAEGPDMPNYDAAAVTKEGPVTAVELDPFFFSKYEMTQGQWLRFTGFNPSAYEPGLQLGGPMISLANPVEQVSWEDVSEVLTNLSLTLPTEAQWEYAARAGTTSVWWTGDERDSLIGMANLADQAAARAGATWAAIQAWPELDDGAAIHAPVGLYAPNPFGIYDVHGNIFEWCRDRLVENYAETSPRQGDGYRDVSGARYFSYRGGSFIYSAERARSAARDGNARDYRASSVGCRPARPLD